MKTSTVSSEIWEAIVPVLLFVSVFCPVIIFFSGNLLSLIGKSSLNKVNLEVPWSITSDNLVRTFFLGDKYSEFVLISYQETVELNVEIRF